MRTDVSEAWHPTSTVGDDKVTDSTSTVTAVAAESKYSKATGINDNASGGYCGGGVIYWEYRLKGETLSQMARLHCAEDDKKDNCARQVGYIRSALPHPLPQLHLPLTCT